MTADPAPRPRRSLRRSVALAFAPLVAVVAVTGMCQFVAARALHLDVRRLFEESREAALVRGLLEEVRGIEQWVEASPAATPADNPMVHADLRRHHAAAVVALERFATSDDPSSPTHDAEEVALLHEVRTGLAALGKGCEAGATPGELGGALASALHGAAALAAIIDRETHAVGGALDRRSDEMTWIVLGLAGVVLGTVAGLAAWLAHRVLRPVRELQRAAVALGNGDLAAAIPPSRADELGDLAATLRTMAARLREHRSELEARVEARSREVVRSARLAQLGTLAGGIAHEINNPLASLVAASEGLLRELAASPAEPAAGFREYLQILHKEALRVRDITARLLDLARQDAPRRERVHLAAAAREVAALLAHQAGAAGVRIELRGDGDGPAIDGDPAAWRQVLFNLVHNALDASPRGGVIRIAVERAGDDVRLSVTDDGPGVPADLRDRVFEPLFTTKEPGRGTGLGLAIVHRIVEAHGGRITVAGRDDGRSGAHFLVTVAAAR